MKRSAVLIELILDVLFLALTLVVLLRLFSAAHETNVLSEQKTLSSLEMQSVMEASRLDPPDADKTLWYDAAFLPADAADAVCRIEIRVSDETAGTGVVRTLALTAFAGEREIAGLVGGCYLAGEVAP